VKESLTTGNLDQRDCHSVLMRVFSFTDCVLVTLKVSSRSRLCSVEVGYVQ